MVEQKLIWTTGVIRHIGYSDIEGFHCICTNVHLL